MAKLSKGQENLLNQLSEQEEMYWCFYGKSATQFNLKTAEALERRGLVKLIQSENGNCGHECNCKTQLTKI